VRQSTKVVVLGTARVMSYEDLKEARAKRSEKDATEEAKKGKCGRKRKSAPEADAPETDFSEPNVRQAKTSETSRAEQGSVPVAKMY